MTTVTELPAGFADKVLSAQSTFRSVMDAMARPGSVQRIVTANGAPAAMMRGTAAIALTLFDHDTPVWLDQLMSATSVEPPPRNAGLGGRSSLIVVAMPTSGRPSEAWISRARRWSSSENRGGPI